MQTTTTWHDLLHPGDATDFFSRREFPPFDPNANGYNRENALWLAELSRLVYRHDVEEDQPPPQPTQTSFLKQAGFAQRQFFLSQKMDTHAMLVTFSGTTPFSVLVFRGTEQTLKDLFTDLRSGIPPFGKPEIVVHKGFQQALDSIWDDIDRALARLTCPVFYTGHSLGAALATLAAAKRRPQAVYTFGSPRVGNRAFVSSLVNIPVYRIVDDQDIVASLPPEAIGFRHVGEEHRLIAPRSRFSLMLLLSPPKLLADHAPVNYVDRISAD
jgi:triacylglycerol lipase